MIHEQSLTILALCFLFISMVCFVVFFLMMMSGNAMSLLKRSIYMIARQTLAYTTQNHTIDFTKLEPEIVGVGIYQAGGEGITHYGSAPPSISPDQKESTEIDEAKQTITVILSRTDRGEDHNPRYIYVEVDIHDQLQRFSFARSVSIFSIFFLMVIMLIFIYLYRRNLNYRKKIAVQERLVHLGEAARTLSHEIKNPLSAIRLQTGYLRRTLPEKSRASINIIEEEVERLSHLSRRVSDFLKDPEGCKEQIDIYKFIGDLAAKFSYPIRLKPFDTNGVFIPADKERLRSIFENIFQNAVESMLTEKDTQAQEVGELKPIEVTLNLERSGLIIDICDNGGGIGGHKKEHLFDPFFTTKSRGSGLGLFIARRFIEALNGRISLSARKPAGTKVSVILPLRKRT